MARLNVPWWMGVVVASFLSYFALLIYCEIQRPEHAGISTRFENDRMHLTAVTPGSPAERAGLRTDDQILAWDGWPISGRRDLMAADVNVAFGAYLSAVTRAWSARSRSCVATNACRWRCR